MLKIYSFNNYLSFREVFGANLTNEKGVKYTRIKQGDVVFLPYSFLFLLKFLNFYEIPRENWNNGNSPAGLLWWLGIMYVKFLKYGTCPIMLLAIWNHAQCGYQKGMLLSPICEAIFNIPTGFLTPEVVHEFFCIYSNFLRRQKIFWRCKYQTIILICVSGEIRSLTSGLQSQNFSRASKWWCLFLDSG